MERDTKIRSDLHTQPFHEHEGRTPELALRAEIDHVQSADPTERRDLRGVQRVATRRAPHEIGVTAARRERPAGRLDLHDRAIPETSDAPEQDVVAEHGAGEQHTGEPRRDRVLRLGERRDAAGEAAGDSCGARDVGEQIRIRVVAALRAVEVHEMQLVRTLADVARREIARRDVGADSAAIRDLPATDIHRWDDHHGRRRASADVRG